MAEKLKAENVNLEDSNAKDLENLKVNYTVQITCWESGKTYKRYFKMTKQQVNKFFGIDGSNINVKTEVSNVEEALS